MPNSLIQIRPDILSGLVWVQTVCKSYQQTTLGDKELNALAQLSSGVRYLIIGVNLYLLSYFVCYM